MNYIIGEYYWVKTEHMNPQNNKWWTSEWEVCQCISAPNFKDGIGFESIGVEGTAYPITSIVKSIHIQKPEDEEA